MDTSFFEEFVLLAEIASYAETADRLAISESALSRHIKAMEAELGARLFDRTSRSVRLSECGQIFLPFARQFLHLEQTYKRELQAASGKSRNTLIIGTLYYIDDLLSQFHKFDNNIAINYVEFSANEKDLKQRLRTGECEIAFIIDLLDPEDEFVSYMYDVDEYVAVLPAAHPLAHRDSVSLEELRDEDFISFNKNAYGDVSLRRLCHKAGFEPKIVYVAVVGSAIVDLVQASMGISILQKKTLEKKMKPQDVAIVDIRPAVKLNISLCYMRGAELSEAAKKFIHFVTHVWPAMK